MRYLFFILFLFVPVLQAQKPQTCNTVQLLSVPLSKESVLSESSYPQDCKVMRIGKTATVRCGCFERLDGAKQRLEQLKNKYENASLASTYSYRFEDNNTTKETLPTHIKENPTKTQPIQQKQKSSPSDTRTCYSVNLISLPKSQKNLDRLYARRYPKDCKIMEFDKTFGVRCSCFDTLVEAKKRKKELERRFKNVGISKTYRYRFEPDYFVSRVYNDPHKKVSAEEAELRLMLQVFLYKGDLESAYKIAKMGVKRYPNSYYWNQKMADVCQWTNRTAEAIKHFRKMYELHYDPILEERLIQYGLQYYQYEAIEPLVLNKAQKEPTEENIDNLIDVYKKVGLPEKVLTVLESEYKRTKKHIFLTKALDLALEIGDLESAQRYVKLIEQQKPYSKIDAALLAKYYYINRKLDKAYAVLIDAKDKEFIKDANNTKELDYFELTSDIAWYLQKNIPAAKASKKLMDIGKARLVDFERIALVYPDIDNDIAMEAVKEGYKRYNITYMFFSYANDALAKKRYDELASLLASVDEKHSPLVKNPMYWIIKSKIYNHYKKYKEEEEALKKALALSPGNTQIKISLLWHFMDIHDVKNTKLLLWDFVEDVPINESLYFPIASAYFYLDDINRASYYLDEMQLNGDKTVQSIPYKFLLAYVKQIQNDEGAYKQLMYEITDTLKQQMKKKPALKKESQILSNYLRAAIDILPPDKFEKELKKAKPYLKEKDYTEIAYSWAMKNNAYEKAHKIYNKAKYRELWLQFYDAYRSQDHRRTENLLDQYLELLPQGDAVGALVEDGQISRAQSTNFKLLYHNDDNQNSYVRHLDLSKKRTDKVDLKVARLLREPLLQKYFRLINRSYIGDDWYVTEAFDIHKNSSTDTRYLVNPPDLTYRAALGVKKEFERGYALMQAAYNNRMRSYFSFLLDGEYRASTDVTLGFKAGKNIQADATTQLYLGGRKDALQPRFRYQILDSTTIDIQYESSRFHSQDGVYLGRGDYFLFNVTQQFRNGYPDIFAGLFVDKANYHETEGTKGVIEELQPQNYQTLPNPFYNIGINLSYGMANRHYYTRVWRPYFDVAAYYNSDIEDYTYSAHAGFGGKVFEQDHLSVGASYSNYLNGVGGKVFEIYLNYEFLYTLSKEI